MVDIRCITASVGIAISVASICVIAVWRMLRDEKSCFPQKEEAFSQKLVALGGPLVVLGIVFGADRLISYSFMGAGVALSVISAVKSRREQDRSSPEVK